MLIRNAEIWQAGRADLRIDGDRIAAIGTLEPRTDEAIVDALGGALLPGLHDHHTHMAASAARAASVPCGPPELIDAAGLAASLRTAPGTGWLRGIGYHESVMGLPGARELDALCADRPLRIQHRSGRLWLLNSPALELLLAAEAAPPGLERKDGRFTGHLFDEDAWLARAMGGAMPSFAAVSTELATCGVTGITDMSVRNDVVAAAHFAAEAECGALRQRCLLAGTLALADAPPSPRWHLGPAKLHLHENALPDFDETMAFVRAAHEQGRALAAHCTTETELVFALAALAETGPLPGDRIEHAGIATGGHVAEIARLDLAVVSQPHFIAERGDQYVADVEPRLHHALYRLAAFRDAGIALAAGSDAPFGSIDPWRAISAAVSRRTSAGTQIGADEALCPEEALGLYLRDPKDLTRIRAIEPGVQADLVLLDRPWAQARERLVSADVRATLVGGDIIHQRVNQPPVERGAG